MVSVGRDGVRTSRKNIWLNYGAARLHNSGVFAKTVKSDYPVIAADKKL